jgi:hypothetical protein
MLYVLGLYEDKATVLVIKDYEDYGSLGHRYPEEDTVFSMANCRLQTVVGGVTDAKFRTLNIKPHMWNKGDLELESTALDFDEPIGFFERGFDKIRFTDKRPGFAYLSPRLIKKIGCTPDMDEKMLMYTLTKV